MTTRRTSTEPGPETASAITRALLAAGLLAGGLPGVTLQPAEAQLPPEPQAIATVDERHHIVVVTIAPLTIPVTGMHHGGPQNLAGRKSKKGMGGHDSPLYTAIWPVKGWLNGFSVELYDSAGAPLPRKHLHHVSMVNLSRRQLVYPAFERILGAGQEQNSFHAPKVIGVPMEPGMELGTFIGWHNDGGSAIAATRLVIRMYYTPPNIKPAPHAVLPVWLDVNYRPGKSDSYDLPPGPSSRSFEFTVPVSGRILAAGGHMHDYASFVRLEEAATGKVLFSIDAKLDPDRRLLKMPRRIFGAHGEGIRLRAGRFYRIRADYDSPEPDTLKSGAMGIIAILYRPDDMEKWPRVDRSAPGLQVDLTWLETMGIPKTPESAHDLDAHQH
jgi:hypothetical protein